MGSCCSSSREKANQKKRPQQQETPRAAEASAVSNQESGWQNAVLNAETYCGANELNTWTKCGFDIFTKHEGNAVRQLLEADKWMQALSDILTDLGGYYGRIQRNDIAYEHKGFDDDSVRMEKVTRIYPETSASKTKKEVSICRSLLSVKFIRGHPLLSAKCCADAFELNSSADAPKIYRRHPLLSAKFPAKNSAYPRE
eukprot:gene12635-3706_t